MIEFPFSINFHVSSNLYSAWISPLQFGNGKTIACTSNRPNDDCFSRWTIIQATSIGFSLNAGVSEQRVRHFELPEEIFRAFHWIHLNFDGVYNYRNPSNRSIVVPVRRFPEGRWSRLIESRIVNSHIIARQIRLYRPTPSNRLYVICAPPSDRLCLHLDLNRHDDGGGKLTDAWHGVSRLSVHIDPPFSKMAAMTKHV